MTIKVYINYHNLGAVSNFYKDYKTEVLDIKCPCMLQLSPAGSGDIELVLPVEDYIDIVENFTY